MSKSPLNVNGLVIRRSRDFALTIDQLALRPGELTCLTGANGSGKTTLLEAVAGLIKPDHGMIQLLGRDPFDDRPQTKCRYGFVPDDDGWLIPELTAEEYFQLLASLYERAGSPRGMSGRAANLAERLLFTNFQQPLGYLSHGNRKKVQIIAALVHQPRLLIVDELRNGLDPVVIKRAEELLVEFSRGGGTILAATHDLWWGERLADRVLILQAGRVVFDEAARPWRSKPGGLEAKFMELYAQPA